MAKLEQHGGYIAKLEQQHCQTGGTLFPPPPQVYLPIRGASGDRWRFGCSDEENLDGPALRCCIGVVERLSR